MISTERRASAGRPGSSDVAASAWTAIRLTWWATTSCNSRAIRVRSRSAACEDCRSSSASARSARLCAARMLARLARLSRPAAAAVRKIVTWKIVSYGWAWPGGASEMAMPAATSTQAIQRQMGPRRSMMV